MTPRAEKWGHPPRKARARFPSERLEGCSGVRFTGVCFITPCESRVFSSLEPDPHLEKGDERWT